MAHDKNALEAEALKFSVKERNIIRDISFSVGRRETLAIVGPSGSGKSTLLLLINRLQDPSDGRISFLGRPLTSYPVPELRRRIGMVMQQPVMFPGTISENIAYGPTLAGQAEGIKMEEYMGLVGFDLSFLNRSTTELSGGEKQRVAFARTVANKPELLLLDEPTSALDQGSVEIIEKAVNKLRTNRGVSAIWITHDLDQAERVSDKLLVVVDGTSAAFGPTKEVLQNPGSERAKQFLNRRNKGEFNE